MASPQSPLASIAARLFAWLTGGGDSLRQNTTAVAPTPPASTSKQPSDSEWLATYLRRIGVQDERPQLADPQALLAIKRLAQSLPAGEVLGLGTALATAVPTDSEVALFVAQLLFQQQQGDSASPILYQLLAQPLGQVSAPQRLRGRWLLAEIADAAGTPSIAASQLTELLAEDWDYPGARSRLTALRQKLGQPDWAVPLRPSDGLRGATGAAVLAATPTLLGAQGGLAARYRLRQELGCGGSGTVYLADDLELGCPVALKIFHPQRPTGDSGSAPHPPPGLREARLLATLHHPGVVAIYQHGDLGEPGDGERRYYLTMELCEGGSLRSRLQLDRLPTGQALRRLSELCSILQALHQLGIVHGDLKPENLLFRSPQRSRQPVKDQPPYGDLVLSDFGVARRLIDPPLPTVAGTRSYLAPERLHGGPPTAAADLYSFGLVAVELLTSQSAAENLGDPDWAAARPLLLQLLAQLKSPDPAARPDAAATGAVLQALVAQRAVD
jgi:hypothetical protein